MSETKKIGIACAIGGAIGTVVALMVAAQFWWLGLLAGFSGGYVSYEFRAVLRAIPEAWRMTVEFAGFVNRVLIAGVIAFIQELFKFLFKNPFLHFFFLDVGIVALWVILSPPVLPVSWVRAVMSLTGLGSFLLFMVLQMSAMTYEELSELTYREVAVGWGKCALGGLACWVVMLTLPVWLPFVAIYFLYKLFRLIHSDKRLLCGMDAAIGTGLAYVTLARPEMTLAQMVFVIICGGVFGAAFGVINYEVVSKRWLHVEEARIPRS